VSGRDFETLAPRPERARVNTRYGGRAIAALASDPGVLDRTGETLTAGDLAREYGFTDIDGTQPSPFALN
jgi:hypothetical protein